MGYKLDKKLGLTDAQKKVLLALAELEVATPKQLLDSSSIKIGRVMLHRHLKLLEGKKLISRIGTPPKVYYQYNHASETPLGPLTYPSPKQSIYPG